MSTPWYEREDIFHVSDDGVGTVSYGCADQRSAGKLPRASRDTAYRAVAPDADDDREPAASAVVDSEPPSPSSESDSPSEETSDPAPERRSPQRTRPIRKPDPAALLPRRREIRRPHRPALHR